MTGMDVELDALRDWARVLDGLAPLAVPAGPAGLPAALAGRHASAHRALVAALDTLDRETARLRDSVRTAVRSYEEVDLRTAGMADV
jgi:hypothetical protein